MKNDLSPEPSLTLARLRFRGCCPAITSTNLTFIASCTPIHGVEEMRIAQISPLTEAVPPKLYGGTERVISWLTEELVALDTTLRCLRAEIPSQARSSSRCGPPPYDSTALSRSERSSRQHDRTGRAPSEGVRPLAFPSRLLSFLGDVSAVDAFSHHAAWTSRFARAWPVFGPFQRFRWCRFQTRSGDPRRTRIGSARSIMGCRRAP